MRDPFYTKIREKLNGPLDRDLFEECANSLIRTDIPTLVPIPGGTDDGMDGATEGSGPFLICTTSKDVLRNLTGSLKSYINSGGKRREVISATSQELTQRKRTNLDNRARELGFHLRHIYDQNALAERLYHEPSWCKELLGLTGRPSALTIIPQSQRPILNQALIGRESDAMWLRETRGDRLLIGQPGSGKTFLLRALALGGWALFLNDTDKEAIAEAIRSQKPSIIIIDDAHTKIETVSMLRQLRSEIYGDFDIVATSWNGDKDGVAEALQATESRIHELALLTRDEIVDVVKHAGLLGPRDLVRIIVDQSEGRPGLAVTLAFLCLQGDVKQVVYGESLFRNLSTAFKQLVGQEANEILGAFAIGGDAGMQIEVVSEFLNVSKASLRAFLVRLAAGGVLRDSLNRNVSVWPKTLRHILVRDTFFSGRCDLSPKPLLNRILDQNELAQTLVGASAYGAKIPELIDILESASSVPAWRDYASLGKKEAEYVLRTHPELLRETGRICLELAPQVTLPLLMKEAVGGERNLHNSLDYTLRWIRDWILKAPPGTRRAVSLRRILLDTSIKWLESGEDHRVGLQSLLFSLLPNFEIISSDPGSGMTVNIQSGLLIDEELSQVKEMWNAAIRLIGSIKSPDWTIIFSLVHSWAYPQTARVRHIPESSNLLMTAIVGQMLRDLAHISKDRPGIQQWLGTTAHHLGLEIETCLDPDYEVLFPERELNNWKESQERQSLDVSNLAEEWKRRDPHCIASRLVYLENEATLADKKGARWTNSLCWHLASFTADPELWIEALVEKGAPADAVFPFLQRAVTISVDNWERIILRCLDDNRYTIAAVSTLLILPQIPEFLIDPLLEKLDNYSSEILVLCLRNEISDYLLKLLLRHENANISTAAAVGEWGTEPPGSVRASVSAEWREAILRAKGNDHSIEEILKSDPSLAYEWLTVHLNTKEPSYVYDVELELSLIDVLEIEQRISLLRQLEEDHSDIEFITKLVGTDADIYKFLLASKKLSDFHLLPLQDPTRVNWLEKAALALDAGYSAEQVAKATLLWSWSWEGNESDMWRTRETVFNQFREHSDPRIREVATIGAAHAHIHFSRAIEEERKEAIYGS